MARQRWIVCILLLAACDDKGPPGKSRSYVSCCRWKSYHDRYDPSCPWRGRSCSNVPWRYWKACCAGKKAVGISDHACRPAPIGSTCASRGPANLDACCASRNPWTDKSCSAWTTGSCSSVKSSWQDACCAQKWQGQDRWCDRRNHPFGSSCASVGPNALDACCASKDPSTDRQACWAWLPRGDCSTVADQYRPACCQNKAPTAPGCVAPPPPVGTTCASRGPAYHDECCYELDDPSSDRSCSAWTASGSCSAVSSDLQMACCLTKPDGQDPACDSILGSQPSLLTTSAPPEDDSQPSSDALETVTDGPTDVDPSGGSGNQPTNPDQHEQEQEEQQQQEPSPVVDPLGPTEPEQPEEPRSHKSPANKPQPETSPETSPEASPDVPTGPIDPVVSPNDSTTPQDQREQEPEQDGQRRRSRSLLAEQE